MHLLTQLQAAEAADAEMFDEPRGHNATVHHELQPGCFVHVCLGPAGLLVHHGGKGIAIPIAELVKLAQAKAPELVPSALPAALPTSREELEARALKAIPTTGPLPSPH